MVGVVVSGMPEQRASVVLEGVCFGMSGDQDGLYAFETVYIVELLQTCLTNSSKV